MSSEPYGKVGVAVIYCDYRDTTSQTPVNILGSILQQFLFVVMPNQVYHQLKLIKAQGKGVEIGDISQMLKMTLNHFDWTFIYIDTLDELEPQN